MLQLFTKSMLGVGHFFVKVNPNQESVEAFSEQRTSLLKVKE